MPAGSKVRCGVMPRIIAIEYAVILLPGTPRDCREGTASGRSRADHDRWSALRSRARSGRPSAADVDPVARLAGLPRRWQTSLRVHGFRRTTSKRILNDRIRTYLGHHAQLLTEQHRHRDHPGGRSTSQPAARRKAHLGKRHRKAPVGAVVAGKQQGLAAQCPHCRREKT